MGASKLESAKAAYREADFKHSMLREMCHVACGAGFEAATRQRVFMDSHDALDALLAARENLFLAMFAATPEATPAGEGE